MSPQRAVVCAVLLAVVSVSCTSPEPPPPIDDQIAEARRLDLDGEHEAAAALFQAVLDRAPDSYDAHYGLARALDLAGEYSRAREHFTRAIELAPEASREQALRMMGIAWTFVRELDPAAGYFEQVFNLRLEAGAHAGASDVANELARVYLELGDVDRSETWYRKGYDTAARETDRADWEVDLAEMRWAHARARIAARRGQADEARRRLREVERLLDKGTNPDQRIQLPYLRGYVAFHLGELDAAREHLAEADQDDPFILLLQAQTADALGDPAAAQVFYGQVLESTSHAINAAFARPVARERVR